MARCTSSPPARAQDQPPSKRPLVSDLTAPQGLAFDKLNGHEVLYVAEANEIDRYQWLGGRVGARTVVVRNLPDTGPAGADVHTLKNVVIGAQPHDLRRHRKRLERQPSGADEPAARVRGRIQPRRLSAADRRHRRSQR